MKILTTIDITHRAMQKRKSDGNTIGLVPTMGALHEGHFSLIRQANKENDTVVVSIFVNPLQFGPQEDLLRYPRPLQEDLRLCRLLEVDYVFCPSVREMFPTGFKTEVTVRQLSDCLCGISRPGHFTGVATVVAKLFNIVRPDSAYFGQKDAQQAVIIRKMVEDLNFPTKIKVMPIVREKSGLALSSRNVNLSSTETEDAVVLSQALRFARDLIKSGYTDVSGIKKKLSGLIRSKKGAAIEYICIVDAHTLQPLKKITGKCLIALAVFIGKFRLIDNIVITHPSKKALGQ